MNAYIFQFKELSLSFIDYKLCSFKFAYFLFISALALQYMREKNVTHLDLKPQNILLSGLHKPQLKIAGECIVSYNNCNRKSLSIL